MNIKEKIMFLYDYIVNLEEYRDCSTEVHCTDEYLATEIHNRKCELLSLIEVSDFNLFYYAEGADHNIYNLYGKRLAREINVLYRIFNRCLVTGWKCEGYTVSVVKVNDNMLDFRLQKVCRDII